MHLQQLKSCDLAKRIDDLIKMRDAVTWAEEWVREAIEDCERFDAEEPHETELTPEEAQEALDNALYELDEVRGKFGPDERAELAKLEYIAKTSNRIDIGAHNNQQ